MKTKAASVWLCLLLGPPQDPVDRYLKQREWFAEVTFCRSESKTTASESWSKDWRARVTFRMELNKVDALIHSREREIRKPREDLPPGVREAYERQRQAYEKALGLGLWMGDLKQTEELWLTETHERFTRCGGKCGVRGCNALGSRLLRRSGHVLRGGELVKPPAPASIKSFADINHVAGVNLNTLSIDSRRKTFDLKVEWNKSLLVDVLQTERKAHETGAVPQARTETASLNFPELKLEDQPLPEDGATLHGTIEVKDDSKQNVVGEISWTLSPKPLPPVDLLITLADYDNWRPEGSSSEAEPGNHLEITARIEAPGGGEVDDKAKSFWFLLDDVSSEPGICINYPPTPQMPPDLDLKFLPDFNSGGLLNGVPCAKARTDKSAKAEGEKMTGALAVLSAFDWGASGVLRVHAFLESGRMLYGELRGRPGMTQVRIPKSVDGSRIADGWKEKTGASGADDADDETKPVGDARYPGDGLTLYEEYRGFWQDGERRVDEFDGGGDPKTKEFFVCDRSGLDNRRALEAFGTMTELRVVRLLDAELDRQRVVNFNHSATAPHRGAQHGVVVLAAGALGGGNESAADHTPGTPAWRGIVFLRRGLTGPAADSGNLMAVAARGHALMHELLHSCNVSDHAPATPEERSGIRWTLGRDDDLQPCLMEGALRIRVVREVDGVDVTSTFVDSLRAPGSADSLLMRVGSWQGAGSGHPYCVMCTGKSKLFRSRVDSRVRYLIRPEEQAGARWFLCKHSDGLQSNAADHQPEPHFGPAPAGGACLDQIVVNDSAHPRPR